MLAHHLLANSRAPTLSRWQRLDGKPSFEVKGQTRVDDSGVQLSLTVHGVGITRLMDAVARPYVASGQLVPLLQSYFDQDAVPIYGVMLQERHRLPKIRACLDYWKGFLAGKP